jgi:hypothetical protein
MPARVPTAEVLTTCDQLEVLLRALPPPYPDRQEYFAALHTVQAFIWEKAGQVGAGGDGSSVRLHGFRATGSAGLAAACRNWITQVRAKARAAA